MKNKSVKRLFALVLAAALISTAAGCSSSSSTSSASSGVKVTTDSSAASDSSSASSTAASSTATAKWDTTKKDTIVLSVMNNYYTSGWKKTAEDYMKLHPETTVTVDIIADNDALLQKMTTWQASSDLKDAADITHINFAKDLKKLQTDKKCYDFTNLLDQTNPYTGKAVQDCMDSKDIKAYTNENGIYALPFDHVGVAIMVNTTLLKKNNLEVPKTMEDWITDCKKLKDAGVSTPIIATPEASWFLACLADAAYRDKVGDFIVQPTDGVYDEKTMSANASYKYDANTLTCDSDVVFSDERKAIYEKKNQFKDALSLSVWTEYAKLAPYYNANYLESASTEDLSSFEAGNGAFFISGSWNVGSLNADVQKMGDKAFEWETIAFPSYATKPESWASGKIRSLYVMGNTMGILLTHPDSEDHLNRVLDYYMYVYNPTGCATMYENTLNDGYFVQGPVAIKGVNLPDEINKKLEGFVQESSEKGDFADIIGSGMYLTEDKGTYDDAFNKMTTGEYTADKFVEIMSPIALKKVNDTISTQGFDLDPSTKDTPKS